MIKYRTHKIEYAFAVLLAVLTVISASVIKINMSAFADTTSYSDVLTDLQKDENFAASDYKSYATDYSLQVIQIAESTDKELFIYVYQPAALTRRLTATRINMSATANGNADRLYGLTLLSRSGVFAKYLVNDFEVVIPGVEADEPTSRIVGGWVLTHDRRYNITSIYRAWDKNVDGNSGNGNVTDEVAYSVGQDWVVRNRVQDGSTWYSMTAVEVLDVNNEYTGFLRYSDGFQFDGTNSTDAHFYAFSTRFKIDRLRMATMSFETTAYTQLAGQQPKTEKPVPHEITLYGEQRENDGGGWFGNKYTWNELSSTREFVANAEKQGFTFDDVARKNILDNDWIINFYQTDYTCEAGGKDVLITAFIPFGFIWTIINSLTTSGEYVSDVTLLRLEYDYNGEIYNLGVVANIVTGSKDPVNGSNSFDFWQWLADLLGVPRWAAKAIFWGVIGLIVCGIALPIFSLIFPVVGVVIKSILRGLLWIISAPFRFIAWIVKKVQARRERKTHGGSSSSAKKKSTKPKASKKRENGGKGKK